MWILPKQLHTSASVVDTAESDSDSNSFCQACEKSLMWRSKPSPYATWLRRWKRGGFVKHLSLRMLRPSHTNDFLDAWTFYLGDSRVNRLAQQDLERELKTLATSTHTSVEESESADQELFSSKMLKGLSVPKQQTENQFSSMSSESWKAWVTAQRQEYSQRLKSVRPTKESGCSSWPTPAARDYKGSYSPTALIRKDGKSRMDALPQVVEYDQTSWPTPTVAEGLKIGNQPSYGQKGLSNHPQIVGLPDRKKLNKSGKSRELWMTPRAGSCGSTATTVGRSKEKSTHLSGQLNHEVKQRGKLNPNWVEQLMGIPVGWTDLGSWATE